MVFCLRWDNDISTTLNPIVVPSSEDEDSDGEDSDSLDSSDVPPVSESDLNRDRSGADNDEVCGYRVNMVTK